MTTKITFSAEKVFITWPPSSRMICIGFSFTSTTVGFSFRLEIWHRFISVLVRIVQNIGVALHFHFLTMEPIEARNFWVEKILFFCVYGTCTKPKRARISILSLFFCAFSHAEKEKRINEKPAMVANRIPIRTESEGYRMTTKIFLHFLEIHIECVMNKKNRRLARMNHVSFMHSTQSMRALTTLHAASKSLMEKWFPIDRQIRYESNSFLHLR